MRRNRASFASGGRGRCGSASLRPEPSTCLGRRAAEGNCLAALELVWGLGGCEPDSRAVGDGRATGMERCARVEPKGRRRRRVGDQPRRPQPRSRSETARSRHESVPSGAEGVAAPDWAEAANRRRNGSAERNGGRPSVTVCGRIFKEPPTGARERTATNGRRRSPSERSERRRCQAARSSWSFLNQASSLRRRRRASGVHLARGVSSVRR